MEGMRPVREARITDVGKYRGILVAVLQSLLYDFCAFTSVIKAASNIRRA